jgi:hypothetical protein
VYLSKLALILCSLPQLFNIPIDSLFEQRSFLTSMKLYLLLPVLFLQSLKILALNQQSLCVSQSSKFEAQKFVETGDLRSVHDNGFGLRDLIFRDYSIDKTISQGFFGCEPML